MTDELAEAVENLAGMYAGGNAVVAERFPGLDHAIDRVTRFRGQVDAEPTDPHAAQRLEMLALVLAGANGTAYDDLSDTARASWLGLARVVRDIVTDRCEMDQARTRALAGLARVMVMR